MKVEKPFDLIISRGVNKSQSELQPANEEPFTEEEFADLEDGEESKCSDSLWESARKHRKDAISLEEYCRKRGIEL